MPSSSRDQKKLLDDVAERNQKDLTRMMSEYRQDSEARATARTAARKVERQVLHLSAMLMPRVRCVHVLVFNSGRAQRSQR